MNRLWNNPPTTSDGTLDYAALTVAEVRADLAETLSDLVINGGQDALQSLLDAIEDERLIDALRGATAAPTSRLVAIMTDLTQLEPCSRIPEPALELIDAALRELRLAAGIGLTPTAQR